MTIEMQCFASMNKLPEACSTLFQIGERESFDLSADWFRLLEAHARFPDVDARYCVLKRDNAVLGVLPLAVRPLSTGGLNNFYSSLYRPLMAPSVTAEELTTCVHGIALDMRASTFRFEAMDPAHPTFDLLARALYQAGFRVFRFFGFGNWYLPVEGRSFAAYFQGLTSQVRNTVRRREKKFLADGRGELKIVVGGEGLEAAIAVWDKIYRASWKTEEPFPEFVPGLIRMCAARGWLRLGVAYHDGEAVAAQLWIVNHGRAAIYKLAYDEKRAQLSAGTVLTAHLMRHVLDVDRVWEVDYLVGDDEYKKDWMSHRRERWGMIAFNPRTVVGLFGIINEVARRLVKRVIKRVLPTFSRVGSRGRENHVARDDR